MIKRYIYIVCGVVSLMLGIIGIFIPGLPTTPFILLTVWLFTHSSPLLLKKVMSNKVIYRYVTDYKEKGGLTTRRKLFALLLVWTMVSCSILFRVESILMKHIIISLAIVGTIVVSFIVPTAKK